MAEARVTQDEAVVAVAQVDSNARETQIAALVFVAAFSPTPPIPPITPAPHGTKARVSNHPQTFRARY